MMSRQGMLASDRSHNVFGRWIDIPEMSTDTGGPVAIDSKAKDRERPNERDCAAKH